MRSVGSHPDRYVTTDVNQTQIDSSADIRAEDAGEKMMMMLLLVLEEEDQVLTEIYNTVKY